MSERTSEASWTAFWASEARRRQGGCLPGAPREVQEALARTWVEVAKSLPRGGKVLDLATGDGVVLSAIRAARPDLTLIGVDSAAVLPDGAAGISLRPNVRMERLPFDAAGFDLVTSQFGIEYGATAEIVAEVRRVLRPDGPFQFVIHHAGSPIVRHNVRRRAALAWALGESGLLPKARGFAKARSALALPTPSFFSESAIEARRLFPRQSAGEEFARAVLMTLEAGRKAPVAEVVTTLDTLEERGKDELSRIDALVAAALDEPGMARLRSQIADAGLEADEPSLLGGQEQPFAWLVSGRQG
jgi:SAM-dependent methyltransferase